jgi:circadian clock protein KaiC
MLANDPLVYRQQLLIIRDYMVNKNITVLLLRHFEAEGSLRQAISVYKKRYGNHERRIRELRFQPGSIEIGKPLTHFSGILTGNPAYRGEAQNLFDNHE